MQGSPEEYRHCAEGGCGEGGERLSDALTTARINGLIMQASQRAMKQDCNGASRLYSRRFRAFEDLICIL